MAQAVSEPPPSVPPDERPTAPPPSLEQLQSRHPPDSVYRTEAGARILARTLGLVLD